MFRACVIEQQINYYKNKHNLNIRLDMIIAVAEKCYICYSNNKMTIFIYFSCFDVFRNLVYYFALFHVFCELAVPNYLWYHLFEVDLLIMPIFNLISVCHHIGTSDRSFNLQYKEGTILCYAITRINL